MKYSRFLSKMIKTNLPLVCPLCFFVIFAVLGVLCHHCSSLHKTESRQHTRISTAFNSEAVCVQKIHPIGIFFAHSEGSVILASVKMSLPRISSRIVLKMSIFHRRLNDLFLLRRRVMTWLDTAADEAWAQGQISRYPGWYSQLMHITYPIP